MAETKKTKKVLFNEILEIVKGNSELESFINHEIELLNKKSENKTLSKNQVANESIKKIIVNVLENNEKALSITEIQSANDELVNLSNQKISALLTQLINEKLVVRSVDKKKAYFTIVK